MIARHESGFDGRVALVPLFVAGSLSLRPTPLQATADSLSEGRSLFLENQLDRAIPALERATREQPRRAEAYAWLAEAHRRLRQPEAAESPPAPRS